MILSKIYRALTAPLRSRPAMVASLTLILAAPPMVMIVVQHAHMLTLTVVALLQALAYAYLLAAVSMVSRRCLVAWTLTAVFALLTWAVCLPIIFANKQMSPETLMLMLETDSRETQSFMHQFVTAGKCLTAVGLAVCMALTPIVMRRLTGWARLHAAPWLRRSVVAIGLTGALLGVCRLVQLYSCFMAGDLQKFENWSIRQSAIVPSLFRFNEATLSDGVTDIVFTLRGLYLNTRELPRWERVQRQVLAADIPRAAEADSVNVVVIIGESFIKRHSPLYGYPLETTPFMRELADSGRLVAFTDYITTANLTSSSVRNLLNLNSAGDGEPWYASAYFPLIASRAGWRVHLYDNQVTAPRYLVDIQLAAIIRNKLLMRECYQWANDSLCRYDGEFVAMVDSVYPFDRTTGNLDIYHLYGQHFAPAERYPHGAGYDRWTGDSLPYDRPWFTPAKRQTVADYDNATLYNDFVISSIYRRYEGSPTVFVYFSDHGEEMYDASDCNVRNEPSGDLAGWLQRQFEIPLFFFATDSYVARRASVWQRITQSAARPGMLDNIGYTVLSLAGYPPTAPYMVPSRDILSPSYRCPPRYTVSRGLNYDSIGKL